METPQTSSPTPQTEEEDLSKLIGKQLAPTLNDEQLEFNRLDKDHKLNRLNNLIQKSQVYSQIIADNILKSSINRKLLHDFDHDLDHDQQPTPEDSPSSTPNQSPQRKRRKTKKQPKNLKDIMTMLLKSQESSKKNKSSPPTQTQQPQFSTQQPKSIVGTMKDYQLDGLHWLTTLYENGLNGILADEMGLGKTLQCISFLAFLLEQGILGPFLIIVPLSTLSNWIQEFNRFAPTIKVLKYSGSKSNRQIIDLHKLINRQNINVIITSYEISIKDFNKLNSINWKYLIVDEGHRLKNNDCVLIRFLKQLPVSNRLLITGTPLQNNLTELWSLLNFILPDIFSDLQFFQQWFNFDELTNFDDDDDEETRNLIKVNIQENLIKNLHTILKPFILRRLKIDVVKDLPHKKEYLIHIPLTPLQKKLYTDTMDKKLPSSLMECYLKEYVQINFAKYFSTKNDFRLIDEFLFKKLHPKHTKQIKRRRNYREADSDDEFEIEDEIIKSSNLNVDYDDVINSILQKKLLKSERQIKLLDALYSKIQKEIKQLSLQNMMMQLRNICNSPYTYYDPYRNDEDSGFMELLLDNSAKFQVLDTLCSKLFAENHKVLIFSQFTKVLNLLHDWFEYKKVQICRIDGSTSHEERDAEIKSFYNDLRKQVFLLSTRSGGLGINLVPADTVILFDNDWNPQMDLQAIDRVHRIGQTKPVKIFRFVIRNSIEEILISKSSSKRFLEKLIIQMGEFKFNKLKKIIEAEESVEGSSMNVKELLELSKSLLKVNKENDEVKSTYDIRAPRERKELLSKHEISELLDRSKSCYLNKENYTFDNITIFETINNLDK
jgi:ATP-dependent DNA helicase